MTQEDVDLTELRTALGFVRADDDGLVLATGRDDASKADQLIGNHLAAEDQRSFGSVSHGVAGEP